VSCTDVNPASPWSFVVYTNPQHQRGRPSLTLRVGVDSFHHKITVFRADVFCARGKRLESYGLGKTYAAISSGKAL
jgi:hypothetical protein